MTPPLWHHPFPYERAEWKSWLKTQHSENMASDPITSWQVDGKTMEMVKDFIFGGSKITSDGDCSHEIKRHLLLGIKVMINLDSILKSRDTTLPTKVHLVKAMVFPVVMYGCESWTKESWAPRTWCWRRLLRVPWTARRSKQSIVKEISPEYSLEGLMLKLKLQYFDTWYEELMLLNYGVGENSLESLGLQGDQTSHS